MLRRQFYLLTFAALAVSFLYCYFRGLYSKNSFGRTIIERPQQEYRASMKDRGTIIIVGAGLAGLATAHTILQRSAELNVIIVEKLKSTGGNSIKASSGINGAGTIHQKRLNIQDTPLLFYEDTVKSAKGFGSKSLAKTLADNSEAAVNWLEESFGIDLSVVSLLGGHSKPRTHRGSGSLPPGFAIIKSLSDKLKDYQNCRLITEARATDLIVEDYANGKKVVGINYLSLKGDSNDQPEKLYGHVVLTTGGFSASSSLLEKYRPDLVDLPTTNTKETVGDGQRMCQLINANLVDMNKVQVHPTGFVDPKAPESKSKFLAGEALRGEGGILLSRGKRFVDELQTRDVVADKVMKVANKSAVIALDINGYESMKHHVDFYVSKGLMKKGTLGDMCKEFEWDIESVKKEFAEYNQCIDGTKIDPLGRTAFGKGRYPTSAEGILFYGVIMPVVHFTMGGVQINSFGQVLDEQERVIDGLYAAGEVSGGVHGANRLGGSSLLECVVFGRIIGSTLAGIKQT
ncbi:fumarate reductase 2 [Trichomonascus vanleenenianus]|uniref:fumarate reductase 2 n=1 Tax=Trichomonascus vanleenenianus TaxID=2268995 RepID=UPI003ECAE493